MLLLKTWFFLKPKTCLSPIQYFKKLIKKIQNSNLNKPGFGANFNSGSSSSQRPVAGCNAENFQNFELVVQVTPNQTKNQNQNQRKTRSGQHWLILDN
jgi:hypothetical protein